MSVVTRFAPSPTGFLHIGGARTALYSWLFAKKMHGKFVLRIEDTDLERSTQESIDAILVAMQWLGLDYDEGPYYQTKRFDRYNELIEGLLAEGKAYKCYCTKDRLEALRNEQMQNKQKPRYDGLCRENPQVADDFVIRFKNPDDGDVTFDDLVRGKVTVSNNELDDLIIKRTDGSPTYNFTVVVDDLDMGITHVIRGDDHINNTPRQINILKALGANLPIYAHVPMILGGDGKRLSKRHGALSVMQYKEDGILKEALLNYLARLGWSHGDQEIFSIAELIELFKIEAINKAPAAFNMDKLLWLNQHYIKTLKVDYIASELSWFFSEENIDISAGPSLESVVEALKDRAKTLKEMFSKAKFLYCDPEYNQDSVNKHLTANVLPVLEDLEGRFESLSSWSKDDIHKVIVDTAESHSLKMGKIAQPLRVSVTGDTISPSIDTTLVLLGRDKTLSRLKQAKSMI